MQRGRGVTRIVLHPAYRAGPLYNDVALIFLDAPFPTLFDRCMLQGVARPVLADPDAAQLRFAARHPLYLRVAHLTLDTAALTSEETVEALIAALIEAQPPTPHDRL